jgi:hypothetical protein
MCKLEPRVVVHIHNSSIWEAEAGGLQTGGWPGYIAKPCQQNKTKIQIELSRLFVMSPFLQSNRGLVGLEGESPVFVLWDWMLNSQLCACKQVLYRLSRTSSPFCCGYFGVSQTICPPSLSLPSRQGYRHEPATPGSRFTVFKTS